MKRVWVLLLVPVLAAAVWAIGPVSHAEHAAVERAVLDYVEALYEVDPSRIERSVHPDLAKRGFWRADDSSGYEELEMTYEELLGLAAHWNDDGRVNAQRAVKEVVVFDVLDQTATAKLTADWGVDYLHLAKYEGRWQIVNVLWQDVVASLPGAVEEH